jgi:hypothetical protein
MLVADALKLLQSERKLQRYEESGMREAAVVISARFIEGDSHAQWKLVSHP